MYLTQNDMINFQLEKTRGMNLSETIKEIITDDESTDEKKAMTEGIKYYKIKNDILDMDFQVFYINNEKMINKNAANNKIIHAYHKILVDQKVSYIAGKPIVVTAENQKLQSEITDLLGHSFNKMARKWITNASNRGVDYLHIYINESGVFDYVNIPGTEIIPVYDTQFQKNLIGIIRYYKIAKKDSVTAQTKWLYKVEIWDNKQVLFFAENEDGIIVPDPDKEENPKSHWVAYNTLTPDNKIPQSWGRVPFIALKNNEESMTDLQLVKTLIDNYDYNVSDFSNKLQDIAKAIWILRGYKGTSLAEFVKNLNSYNAIAVDKEGSVDTKSTDLPKEAHDSHLDRIEDNIYVFGMGVNPKIDKFGISPSGIALKYFYAGLDLKSNLLITEMQQSLNELAWFITKYLSIKKRIDYNPDEIKAIFNKSILVNELEQVQMAQMSKGIVDDKTILEHHPWVGNVEEVQKRLEQESSSFNLQ